DPRRRRRTTHFPDLAPAQRGLITPSRSALSVSCCTRSGSMMPSCRSMGRTPSLPGRSLMPGSRSGFTSVRPGESGSGSPGIGESGCCSGLGVLGSMAMLHPSVETKCHLLRGAGSRARSAARLPIIQFSGCSPCLTSGLREYLIQQSVHRLECTRSHDGMVFVAPRHLGVRVGEGMHRTAVADQLPIGGAGLHL